MFLEKKLNLENDIIFIDGLWGTGKSILGPIIGGMQKVEKFKLEHIYEYISVLYHLNKIEKDSATWMLNTYADLSQYNNSISREVNLRFGDDSGLKNNPNSLDYLQRLFKKDGDHNLANINENNIALNLMSHMILMTPELLFTAYGDRLKIIEVVRHPLYMIEHWENYLRRFDSPREFTVSFYYQQTKIPWWADEFKDEYFSNDVFNKALISIRKCYEKLFKTKLLDTKNEKPILYLSFEDIVTNPDKILSDLSTFLKRTHHKKIKRILARQRIPRKLLIDGLGHQSYGFKKIKDNQNEEEFYKKLVLRLQKKGSKENIDSFNNLIEVYNKKFPSKLSNYH